MQFYIYMYDHWSCLLPVAALCCDDNLTCQDSLGALAPYGKCELAPSAGLRRLSGLNTINITQGAVNTDITADILRLTQANLLVLNPEIQNATFE